MVRTLAQISDGRSAWAEFYSGVTAAFEANESAVPVIGLVLLAVLVMFLNIRLAVWLARRWGGSKRGGGAVR
ncbi:MAG: hypothetical protein AAFS11_06020 [Planctomycetota bacterium]